jgi:pimeloyl-ACP methyl ester carboxylesterase
MAKVVLVHGLWMPGTELALLRRRLAAAGHEPVQFRYASVTADIDANADRLAAFLAKLSAPSVHLIGHSLGALLILKCIARHGADRISRIVCLGPPFTGTAAGDRLARLPGGTQFMGRGIAQLRREAPTVDWDGRRELGIIAGDCGLGMGRLLGGLPTPNDGTVAVAETRLVGATDHVVLPVTHFSMLWSRRVAEQVIAFLRDGRFSHAAA